jgi:hypothetical protein
MEYATPTLLSRRQAQLDVISSTFVSTETRSTWYISIGVWDQWITRLLAIWERMMLAPNSGI